MFRKKFIEIRCQSQLVSKFVRIYFLIEFRQDYEIF